MCVQIYGGVRAQTKTFILRLSRSYIFCDHTEICIYKMSIVSFALLGARVHAIYLYVYMHFLHNRRNQLAHIGILTKR